MKKVTATSIAIALLTTTSAIAQTVKYDTRIAKAAAGKAAEKMGKIYGTIGYDQYAYMVTKEDLIQKPLNTTYIPPEPETDTKALPPITELSTQIDAMITSSIKSQPAGIKPRIIWEKFDRYGNPIK